MNGRRKGINTRWRVPGSSAPKDVLTRPHVHPTATRSTDLTSRVLGAPAVSTDDRQVCSHSGQAHRRRAADASAATGYQHSPTGDRPSGP